MKLAAAIITSFTAVASAKLRAVELSGFKSTSSNPADARIILHGLLHEATAEDNKIIQQSIVSAYNKAYAATGYSLGGLETLTSVPIPDGVQSMQDCSPCVNDNTLAVNQGEVIFARVSQDCSPCGVFQDCSPCHEAFEMAFCQELRSSGSANLAGVRDCSFSFLETPIKAVANVGEETEAQIMMHGILHDLSTTDLAIIDRSLIAAYEDAFAATGYALSTFAAVSYVDVPVGNLQDCSPCGDSATVVFARAMQDCSPCRSTFQDCSPCVEALEKAFCSKLQNSGSANLANVHSCSFRFVKDGAKSAQN